MRRLRVIRTPDSAVPSVPVPSAGERADQASRLPDGTSSTRTARAVILPVLLVGCLGALVLPAADAVPYAARPATSVPQAAAAMLLPPGTEVDPSAVVDERAPRRTFVTAPPAIGPSGTAEVERSRRRAPGRHRGRRGGGRGGVVRVRRARPTDATGIPVTVLAAYRRAEAVLAAAQPSCHLSWWLLAGVGRIETGHVYGGRVDEKGNTRGRIMGPVLDGSMPGTAVIRDSDGGKWDGDAVWDRAVGPMQFLPGSWVYWGKDGNSDGVSDPHNVFDATVAAGYLLCSAGDLSNPATMGRAVLRYNHSASYVATVLKWAAAYRDNVTPAPDSTGSVRPRRRGRPRRLRRPLLRRPRPHDVDGRTSARDDDRAAEAADLVDDHDEPATVDHRHGTAVHDDGTTVHDVDDSTTDDHDDAARRRRRARRSENHLGLIEAFGDA